ncbi:MAG: hypothetical protein BAA02_09135 [Paenibacillaceae bacterium ZCTH02-B3]|nr:MAG: hypothetical protein BAA02_09135 [Paenibacillaceae bacterium ZCTH02-B3]
MAERHPLSSPPNEEALRELWSYRLWLRLRRMFKWTLWCLAALLAASGALFLYALLVPLPAVPIYQTTTVYSADGQPLYDLHGQGINRRVIPLSEIPKTVIQATIAVEDRSFYQHFGFNPKRMLKAVWVNATSMELNQGASTITQQLARNLYLSHEKTWERKIKEALYALQLEVQLSKEEILSRYLNQIYYGESAYGIQAAAETYFGKNARDLTPAEATLLAGIPKNPTRYSPFRDLDAAKKRQRVVLQSMVEAGYLTPEQMETIAHTPVTLKKKQEKETIAPYFLDYILREAQKTYGIDRDLLQNGGLQIFTTLDPAIQKAAEQAVRELMPKQPKLQVALAAIEPSTGAIRALVGGRHYEDSQFNRTLALRQPGSSFKPFLYLAALENGWTTTTLQTSEPTVFTFGSQEYRPRNFADQYANRPITMREAVRTSDNIYAIKTHLELGPEKLVEMARRLGIQRPLQPLPSLALGSEEVTPLEMASAYATIAGQGKRVAPTAIVKITDATGKTLAEARPVRQQVIQPQQAYLITSLLQAPFEPGGTAHRISQRLSRPVAGKTGTTDFDAWMVGFTPQLSTAVWVGYDQPRKLSTAESRIAAVIWADFMERAHADRPVEPFVPPEGIISAYVDPQTGQLAGPNCPTVSLEVFATGTEPKQICQVHNPQAKPPAQKKEEETPRPPWRRWIDWFH